MQTEAAIFRKPGEPLTVDLGPLQGSSYNFLRAAEEGAAHATEGAAKEGSVS